MNGDISMQTFSENTENRKTDTKRSGREPDTITALSLKSLCSFIKNAFENSPPVSGISINLGFISSLIHVGEKLFD